jgi:succinyl-CoA synthetase beta subunit
VKIHEYQAKAILARHGVPVPPGEVAETVSEVDAIARRLGGTVVVKAQIHAGGRGKGGGVKLATSAEEAKRIAAEMIGMRLITHQTGPEGRIVKRILVEAGMQIARELYLGLVIDRAAGRPVLMASPAGGMEIEKVAAETPHLIFKAYIDPATGLLPFQARSLAFSLGLEGPAVGKAAKVMAQVVETFMSTDASLVEINPLVVTASGDLIALDAKMNLDDNALFRHPVAKELRDFDEEDPLETEASKYALNYIRLDGDIGCMVNGAGLAMATMDVIKLAGGEPANFLDVGGGATADQIRNAVRILTSDHNVRAVFVNIFGGILRCDILAEGLVAAVKELNVTLPIVIRMEGTNVDAGKRMLRESGLNFTTAEAVDEAAATVVKMAGGR